MTDCHKCHEEDLPKRGAGCPPKVIQINNPQEPILFHRVDIPATLGDDTTYPPKAGLYKNVLLVYEANNHAYLYSSDGIPTIMSTSVPQEVLDDITDLQEETVDLQDQIDEIKNSPDVVDVVATKAALDAYDTSTLTDKDVVRVLADETHDGQSTYYRWNATSETWTYIGAVGDYYTKTQTDDLLAAKQNTLTAGANITIVSNEISATDTTYSAGTGLSLTGTTFAVDTTTIAEKTDIPTQTSALTNNGSDGTSTYVEADELATVATTGSYTDLINKPTIPAAQIQSDWAQSDNTKKDYIKNKPTLATVATTGSYNDLTDKPTIPVDEVIYIPITITSVQDMTFSTTETSAEVIAMMDAGKKVMYRMTIPSQVGTIAPGVYDFTAQYYYNSTVFGVMTGYITGVTVGILGHASNAGQILMFNLQEKIDANNKLSADYIDSSNSTNKTYVTGSGAPTTSTAGTVGQIYVDTATGKVYVCTSASGGTYTWAEVSGVQSDWNQTSSSAPDYIKNKPTIPTVNNATLTVTQNGTSKGTFTANASSNKTIALTDTTYTNFTGADASTAGAAGLVPAPAAGDNTKYLSGDGTWKTVSQYSLPIATANDLGGIKVGSRLSIDSSTGVLSANSQTDNNFTNTLKTKLDGIASGAEVNVQADWNEASSSSDAYIKNKPTIPAAQVNSDWNANSGVAQILNKPSLATVATSGSYNDLTNKPTIPAAQIQSDWTQTTTTAKDYIKNKPSLATVATSGSYTDLSNKPSIPAAQVNSDWNANSGVSQILNKPSLATVATSGSYSDLSNKPTIPTVNNSTITITNNGSTVDSFTTNASTGKTIALSAPVITMQTTDPGEGVALAANNFIAVY